MKFPGSLIAVVIAAVDIAAVVLSVALIAGCSESLPEADQALTDQLSAMPGAFLSDLPPPSAEAEPPPAPPDVPAAGEPGTPAGEIVARFAEYQAAFCERDGELFLSLHTADEQLRQITTCVRILAVPLQVTHRRAERSRRWHARIDRALNDCGATDGIRAVARAYDPADPIAFAAAVQTICPKLKATPQLVSDALDYLQKRGAIEPQLFNLAVHGDRAEADLVLRPGLSSDEDRSRLKFARQDDLWYIAEELSAGSALGEAEPVAAGMP
ncbi:MAG: hypothetical protein WD872_01735 [Pirellulaceae bacterium]